MLFYFIKDSCAHVLAYAARTHHFKIKFNSQNISSIYPRYFNIKYRGIYNVPTNGVNIYEFKTLRKYYVAKFLEIFAGYYKKLIISTNYYSLIDKAL